jgi:hypothetical protein
MPDKIPLLTKILATIKGYIKNNPDKYLLSLN